MSILQRIERAMFGASAEERVALQIALIDRRIEQTFDRLFQDEEDQDTAHDTAAEDTPETGEQES